MIRGEFVVCGGDKGADVRTSLQGHRCGLSVFAAEGIEEIIASLDEFAVATSFV